MSSHPAARARLVARHTAAARNRSLARGFDQSPNNNRERKERQHLLLTDVPASALPTDILRALKEVGAVKSDFPLGSITSSPPSLPRQPSMTKSVHLTASSPAHADDIMRNLSLRPLFPTSSRSLTYTYPRSSSSSAGPSDGVRVTYSGYTAEQWVNKIIESAKEASGDRGVSLEVQYNEVRGEWAMRPEVRGRRVVLTGLPGRIQHHEVRHLAKDHGLQSEPDACKRLPPTPWSNVSTWVLTTESVATAYALARKLNMNQFYSSANGEPYLMRAKVAW